MSKEGICLTQLYMSFINHVFTLKHHALANAKRHHLMNLTWITMMCIFTK